MGSSRDVPLARGGRAASRRSIPKLKLPSKIQDPVGYRTSTLEGLTTRLDTLTAELDSAKLGPEFLPVADEIRNGIELLRAQVELAIGACHNAVRRDRRMGYVAVHKQLEGVDVTRVGEAVQAVRDSLVKGAPSTPTSSPTPGETVTPTPAETAAKAGVGDTLNIAGNDAELQVTLTKTKQLPAASLYGTTMHPALFGVQLTIKDSGKTVYDDSIYNCVALVDAEDQSHNAEFAVTDERGNVLSDLLESLKIVPGDKRSGWMYFALKPEQKPRTLQFTADSGLGPEVGEWSLR